MNINGQNALACVAPVSEVLTGMPVIRDLVVDQTHFFDQYRHIKPWLINDDPLPTTERLQSPEERARLDGLYECILFGCLKRALEETCMTHPV